MGAQSTVESIRRVYLLREAIPLVTASKIGFEIGFSDDEENRFIDLHPFRSVLLTGDWL